METDSKALTITLSRQSAIVAVCALLAVAASLIAFRILADRNARLGHAREAVSRYTAATERLSTLSSTLVAAQSKFDDDTAEADDASQERHDYLSSGQDSDEHALELVTKETTAIDSAGRDQSDIHIAQQALADFYAGLYGDGAVRTLRADVEKSNELTTEALTTWGRAAGDIRDSIHAAVNGQYSRGESSDEIETLYSQSDQFEAQAKAADNATEQDERSLFARLQTDLHNAKATLAALK